MHFIVVDITSPNCVEPLVKASPTVEFLSYVVYRVSCLSLLLSLWLTYIIILNFFSIHAMKVGPMGRISINSGTT